MIKLCVFDLAGTTIKDTGGIVNDTFRKAFAKHNLIVSPVDIDKYMGMAKPVAIKSICIDKQFSMEPTQLESIHNAFVQAMKEYYYHTIDRITIDGVNDTFAKLQSKGIKVAIDTGFSKEITDVIIHRVGWLAFGLVDAVVSSDEVAQGRPHPDMIKKIMYDLGLTDPSQVAKIGDTPSDLLEGQNAKCEMVVGVCEGSHTREQLEPYYHTHLIANVNGLIALI